jgi:hypothetical protein
MGTPKSHNNPYFMGFPFLQDLRDPRHPDAPPDCRENPDRAALFRVR